MFTQQIFHPFYSKYIPGRKKKIASYYHPWRNNVRMYLGRWLTLAVSPKVVQRFNDKIKKIITFLFLCTVMKAYERTDCFQTFEGQMVFIAKWVRRPDGLIAKSLSQHKKIHCSIFLLNLGLLYLLIILFRQLFYSPSLSFFLFSSFFPFFQISKKFC